MPSPKFVQRISRLPEVLNVLAAFPDGLPLRVLAEQVDVDVEHLRQDLLTYVELESWGWMYDIFRRPAIEYVLPDRDDVADAADIVVRVFPEISPGLGVEHLSAGDLAVLYTAGVALLDVDPDDDALAGALEVIAETMYGEPSSQPSVGDWNRFLGPLREAAKQHRMVRIEYSRAWHEGVSEPVIEPLRLVQTQRGWEVDAGPVRSDGNLRSYLLSNIRSAAVLDETFEPPDRLEDRLAAQRRTTTVRLALAQAARWAPDMYAERVKVLQEDESSFIADLELLQPVGERVALLLLAGGSESRVLEPTSLLPDALGAVERILEHHANEL